MMSKYHVPVMLDECLEGLQIKPEGTYVDVTFGGGGHSKTILDRLSSKGRLLAFDQDADALNNTKEIENRSFTFIQANFRHLKKYLRLYGIRQVDGVLADLGVSSHQIDEGSRGFSTRFDAPLDMRMDQKIKQSAYDVIQTYSEQHLHKMLGMYGEVRNAKTLASAFISARQNQELRTTFQLIEVLKAYAPRGREFKYYAQVFQALRIEVNEEMAALEEFLEQTADVIQPHGRLVVMSYHSLEDRLVKHFIQKGKFFGSVEKDFFGNEIKPFKAINRKPIEANQQELTTNSRSRSAKLRVAERQENG